MNNDAEILIKKIQSIVDIYFDSETINNETYVKAEKIRFAIEEFTEGRVDWKDGKIFTDLRTSFPGFNFDNQTHFFNNDRCLRFYADKYRQIKTEAYVVMISIFGFFSICRKDYETDSENRFKADELFFVEKQTNTFCDAVFDVILIYYPNLIWLPNNILKLPAFRFYPSNKKIRKDIIIADLLFTHNR